MATPINIQQSTSLLHKPPTLNPPQTHNPFSSLKFLYNPTFSQLLKACNLSNPITPLTTWGQSWAPNGLLGRADFRAWSSRRSGSKKKNRRVTVTIECTGCRKNRYTTEKRRVSAPKAVSGPVHVMHSKMGEVLELSKYCPHCREHKLHKEVKK